MDLGENGDGLTLGLTNSGTPFLKKSPHTCAVCNFTFKTESQLFNHLDNCGLRRKYEHLILWRWNYFTVVFIFVLFRCGSTALHKVWRKRIKRALQPHPDNMWKICESEFTFEPHNYVHGRDSKEMFVNVVRCAKTNLWLKWILWNNLQSPVWNHFSRVRFFKELVPYVYHHEGGCGAIIHWSGSTSCLKRHLIKCPHVGQEVQPHLRKVQFWVFSRFEAGNKKMSLFSEPQILRLKYFS